MSTKQKRRSNVFWVVVALLAVVALASGASFVPFWQQTNVLGTTRYLAKGDGGDGSSSGGSDSGSNSGSGNSNSGSGSSGSGSSDSGGSRSDSSGSGGGVSTETRDEVTDVRTQTDVRKEDSRTEIRLSETERVRTRTKDGTTRIDITSGGIKTRFEQRDDRIILKAETEDGSEAEFDDDTILKIEERLGRDGIKVATAGADRFLISRGNTGAVTDFPLSIDLSTNTLLVNTPAGEKAVTVLPDQAVQNLIAANVISRLGGLAVADLARSGSLTTVSELITLGEVRGIPVYEIRGFSDQRIVGLLPVKVEKTVTVSAETGVVLSQFSSPVNLLLDLISF